MAEPVLSPAALDKLLDEIETDAFDDGGPSADERPAAIISPSERPPQ